MSTRSLVAFPGAAWPPGISVTAAVEVATGFELKFTYRLGGDLSLVRVPPHVAPIRADRLWERTCFEAFVSPAGGESYVELNFSPSTEWAAYAFDGYRRGMRPVELARPPRVDVALEPRALVVTASVDFAALADAGWPWRVGLTAVITAAAGQVSHWALAHPASKPDFHDAAGFLLTLEGTTR